MDLLWIQLKKEVQRTFVYHFEWHDGEVFKEWHIHNISLLKTLKTTYKDDCFSLTKPTKTKKYQNILLSKSIFN